MHPNLDKTVKVLYRGRTDPSIVWFVQRMIQLKMIKLVNLSRVDGEQDTESCSQANAYKEFGQPDDICNWGQPLTIKILWSALSNYEFISLPNSGFFC